MQVQISNIENAITEFAETFNVGFIFDWRRSEDDEFDEIIFTIDQTADENIRPRINGILQIADINGFEVVDEFEFEEGFQFVLNNA